MKPPPSAGLGHWLARRGQGDLSVPRRWTRPIMHPGLPHLREGTTHSCVASSHVNRIS